MSAGDMTDGVSHSDDREPESQCHSKEADAQLVGAAAILGLGDLFGRKMALPQPPKTNQNVPNSSAPNFEASDDDLMCRLLVTPGAGVLGRW